VFQQIYEGISYSTYEVDESGFLSNRTGWAPEYVREKSKGFN